MKDIHNKFDKNILVPMTLVRPASYTNIIQKLLDDGIAVKFIILEANYENVHDRILARGEDEDCWCMENIEMSSNASKAIEGGCYICTDNRTVEELVDEVMKCCMN